jgi:CBS domain-containing protein
MDTQVKDILREKGSFVLTIAPEESVFSAISKMVDHNVGSIVIVDEDGVQGIFTERDYLRDIILEERSSKTTAIRDVMTTDLIVVDPEYDAEECMAIMTEQKIRHLPVVEQGDSGDLAGLISIGDCVKRLSEDRKTRIRSLEQYIKGSYQR